MVLHFSKLVKSKKSNSIRFDDWNLISEYKSSSYRLMLDSLISDLVRCSEDIDLKKLVRVISTCINLIQEEFDLDLRTFQFEKNPTESFTRKFYLFVNKEFY